MQSNEFASQTRYCLAVPKLVIFFYICVWPKKKLCQPAKRFNKLGSWIRLQGTGFSPMYSWLIYTGTAQNKKQRRRRIITGHLFAIYNKMVRFVAGGAITQNTERKRRATHLLMCVYRLQCVFCCCCFVLIVLYAAIWVN